MAEVHSHGRIIEISMLSPKVLGLGGGGNDPGGLLGRGVLDIGGAPGVGI